MNSAEFGDQVVVNTGSAGSDFVEGHEPFGAIMARLVAEGQVAPLRVTWLDRLIVLVAWLAAFALGVLTWGVGFPALIRWALRG